MVVRESPDIRRLLEIGAFSEQEVWRIWRRSHRAEAGPRDADERIMIRASGLVTHDVALAHFVYRQALERGVGVRLPVG